MKNNMKSVRMDDTTMNFVLSYRGTGFNEKFENIIFDMNEKLPALNAEIQRREQYLEEKYKEMKKVNHQIKCLRDIDIRIKPVINALLEILPDETREL